MTDPLVGEKALPMASTFIDHAARAAVVTRRTGSNEPRHHRPALLWQAFGVLAAVALTIAFFAVGPHAFDIQPGYALVTKHLVVATSITALILAGQKLTDVMIDRRTLDDSITFFNLCRVIRLVAAVLVCLVFLSLILQT